MKEILFVSDVNGVEVKQPFHLSGVGLYNEVADTSVIEYIDDPLRRYDNLKTAIAKIAAAKTRMIRLFCCHYSEVDYSQNDTLHTPFKLMQNGKFNLDTFDLENTELCNIDWRERLRAVIDKAKDPDGSAETQDAVIVQLSLFDGYDLVGNSTWPNSVWNNSNSNAGISGTKPKKKTHSPVANVMSRFIFPA